MSRFLCEYGLISSQRTEVIASGGRDLSDRFEDVNAARILRAQTLNESGCVVEFASIGKCAGEPDLRLYALRGARYRLSVKGFGQIVALQAAGRVCEALDYIGWRTHAVDLVEQRERCGMIARPAEYDRVIAEHVLTLGKTLYQRPQRADRLLNMTCARIFDRVSIKNIRGIYGDDMVAVRGKSSSRGESNDR